MEGRGSLGPCFRDRSGAPVRERRLAALGESRGAADEPPAWYYPVRESLGAALLRAGRSAAAEKVFRTGIEKSPRNGRMLFGLVESLRAQGKNEDAGWVRKELDAAWAKADVKLRLDEM